MVSGRQSSAIFSTQRIRCLFLVRTLLPGACSTGTVDFIKGRNSSSAFYAASIGTCRERPHGESRVPCAPIRREKRKRKESPWLEARTDNVYLLPFIQTHKSLAKRLLNTPLEYRPDIRITLDVS